MATPTLDPEVSTASAIKQLLRNRLGKQWGVGDRLPPVKDLARQLGTGQSNTHLAVKALAEDGLLVSHRRRGTFVAELPESANASALNTSATLAGDSLLDLSTKRIALYGPDREFVRRMMRAFAQTFEPTGAEVVTIRTHEDGFCDVDQSADAMVMINPSNSRPINCPTDQLLTVITTTRFVTVNDHPRYDIIMIDEHQGAMLAGQRLRELGCERPCFFGRQHKDDPTRYDATSDIRLHGFEEGFGQSVPGDRLFKVDGYNWMAGGRAFGAFIQTDTDPDGIFAASDDIAYGLIAAAGSHGFLPGEDFSIVGFDGQGRGGEFGGVKFPSVSVPCEALGRRAGQLLMHRFAEPDKPVDRLSLDCVLQTS